MRTLIIGAERFLLQRLTHCNLGTRVGQARHHTHENRKFQLLRQRIGIRHHIICLLLRRRLHNRDHSKFAIESRILLVLRRVHRGVIGSQHHESAIHTRNGRVDKRIGSHIHTHMFHTYERALTGIRHTQGSLHGRLLIRTPAATHLRCMSLYIFSNLGRWRTRISIHTTYSSMYSS